MIERYRWEREYPFGRWVFLVLPVLKGRFFSRAVVFSGKDLCPFFEFQGRRVLHLMHPTFGMFGVSLFSSVSMEKKNMETGADPGFFLLGGAPLTDR